jgi:predicted AAA+ superfamily ATPase
VSGVGSLLERLEARVESVLALSEALLSRLVGRELGARDFKKHLAFQWDGTRPGGGLIPIEEPARFDLDDLRGVDDAVAAFRRNTEQFMRRLPFNHVLLYGDRGTGKSSAVRGMLARYGEAGLRLVEVSKSEWVHLPEILVAIRGAGDEHRFLIFCDDLSFGAGEPGYRELKACLDGSLAGPTENVCLVVTSNRRHLVSQSMADNRQARLDADNELHLGEVLEEKLALADRFGLALGFYCFDQPTYLEIVAHYLSKELPEVSLQDVREDALRWATRRGTRSGRTARQFVNDYIGSRGLPS